MKTLKLFLTTIFLFAITISFAQKVDYNGTIYTVKRNAIFMGKSDVTSTLSPEEQVNIKNRLSKQISADKKLKTAKKAQKKAEKAQNRAKKRQRAAEKKIKTYADAKNKYERGLKKYQKLQKKGKVSSEDEVKWQKKLKGLKIKLEKLKRKM